jgi:peptidoglycan/xylan/chitin deacetylase (PgdA/CDA1 family)
LYVACADPPKKVARPGAGAGGAIGEAGASENGGTNATSGTGGTSGGPIAEGGEGGVPEAAGGEGGIGAEGGEAGAPPVDVCNTLTVGGPSKLPVPPTPTTSVPKPAGAVGGLKVVNWAGFKGAITYTFDDNLQSQKTHYAELHAVGVPMTFYIVGSNNGADPIWTQAAKDGHELGNHTMHHCRNNKNASECTWGPGQFAGADAEIDECTAILKSTFGVAGVYTMAAPFGDSNWESPASERFIINRGVADDPAGVTPNSNKSAMAIPCHITKLGETAAELNLIADDVRAKGSWRTVLAHNVDPDIIDYGYNPVKLADIVGTMTYAKGLGDVWADTMVAIGAYWVAQKALFTVEPVTIGSDKVYSWTLPAHFPPGHHLRITVTGGKVTQCGTELAWDDHGYYELNLDAGSVTISPP